MRIGQLFEGRDLPRWFKTGLPVMMTDARWADEADFLDPEEFDLDWRLCRVPAVSLRGLAKPTLADFIAHMNRYLDRNRMQIGDGEEARLAEIEAWFEAEGSVDAALRRSPLVMTLDRAGRVDLLDGHHRNALVQHRHPVPALWALVGAQR